MIQSTTLQSHFDQFRKHIIGLNQTFQSPNGEQKIIYADWIASGRMYAPIEEILTSKIAPYVANTHTETSLTGSTMTHAYHHQAREIIKQHVNATNTDILISSNSGMTGVINKFQRILGLKLHENFRKKLDIEKSKRPIVFITHMEHHSNQTSWLETICDVEIIKADSNGLVCLHHLSDLLVQYQNRELKIAAITSCSNVTGIETPYREIAKQMHLNNGFCFVDFACSAPYIDIDMHPTEPLMTLDAIYFSPHKFLGGPSSSGILIFDQKLYNNKVPDNPGGGRVDWTNPWGEHKYYDQIEAREDGGTPSFLQTMRVALAIKLKEEMNVQKMHARERELTQRTFEIFKTIPNLHVLADNIEDRLGVMSFYIDDLHYNLAVKLLNDRFGIQVRGGCSCAGTYGHYLLEVSKQKSSNISTLISDGDLSVKPGWVRLSLHPTMTNEELEYVLQSISELSNHHKEWGADYLYNPMKNEFYHASEEFNVEGLTSEWFCQVMH